jgi:hypothetical protein
MGNVVTGLNTVQNEINFDGLGSQNFAGTAHNVSSTVSNFVGTGVNFTGANQLVTFNGTGVNFGLNAKITYSDPTKININGTSLFDSSNKIQQAFIPTQTVSGSNISGAVTGVTSISSTGGVTGAFFSTTGTYIGGSFSGTTGIFSGAVTGSTFYGDLGAATVSYNALTGKDVLATTLNSSDSSNVLKIGNNASSYVKIGAVGSGSNVQFYSPVTLGIGLPGVPLNINGDNFNLYTSGGTGGAYFYSGVVSNPGNPTTSIKNGNITTTGTLTSSGLTSTGSITGSTFYGNLGAATVNYNALTGGAITASGLITASGGLTSSGLITASGGLTSASGITGANMYVPTSGQYYQGAGVLINTSGIYQGGVNSGVNPLTGPSLYATSSIYSGGKQISDSGGLLYANGAAITNATGQIVGPINTTSSVTGANLYSSGALTTAAGAGTSTSAPTGGIHINGTNNWVIGENSTGQLCFYNTKNSQNAFACFSASGYLLAGTN